MNTPATKRALGVDPSREFASCNMEVNQAFALQGDGAHNSAKLLPALVEDGVRLLVYAGNADMMCNFIVRLELVEHSTITNELKRRVTSAGLRSSKRASRRSSLRGKACRGRRRRRATSRVLYAAQAAVVTLQVT